jgi:phosphatidate cytidylyltransferase
MPSVGKDRRTFIKRAVSAAIAIPVVAAVVWFGAPWTTILAVAWSIGAVLEFYTLVKYSKGLSPLVFPGMVLVLLFVISPHFENVSIFANISFTSLLLTASVMLPLAFLLGRKGKENAFANWAWTLAGILYIGWLMSYLVALRALDNGAGWVYLALLCTFASDICAYLVGRSFGRHKMAPYISPGKTWEGAVSGVAGAIIVSVVVILLFGLPVTWWGAIILGVLISVIGQVGDLVKSLFKRNVEVKDSGNFLPGHGGFLDRMDSIAFAGVTVYYFAVLSTLGV